MKTVRWSAGACVAALAFALNCGVASAQLQTPPAAPKAGEPAKKAEPQKKAPAKAAKPACNSLKEETACVADTTCQWVAASKNKQGKEIKAYCRTTPKPKAAADKAKAPAPAKDAAPKAPAAKAPAPAKDAAPKAPASSAPKQ